MCKEDNRFKAIKNIALFGIVFNIVLLVLKLAVGYTGDSRAMIADGFNSLGDVSASVIALSGGIIAARPKDDDHNFGHGKAEFLASLFIGISMVIMSAYTGYGSCMSLIAHSKIDDAPQLIAVAAATIVTKFILFIWAKKKSKEFDSILIYAAAYDHRNDVFITGGTLCAILISKAGFYWGDGVAGLVISVWIAYTGIKIIIDSSRTLMDESVTADKFKDYRSEVMSVAGIAHIDSIDVTPTGSKYVVIVKISVDKNLTVANSHDIAKRIEDTLLIKFPEIQDVIVHVNPDIPHNF